MFCPKCDKFISSSATSCKNCGLEIISGYSPNYGRGFELIDNDRDSRNPLREDEELRENTHNSPADPANNADNIDNPSDNAENNNNTSFTDKLKSIFGFK